MPMPHRTQMQLIKRRLVGKDGSERIRELRTILGELPGYKNGPYADIRKWVEAQLEHTRVQKRVTHRDSIAVRREGAVYSVFRTRDNLNVDLRFTADPFRTQRSKFFILGRDSLRRKRACQIRLPGCSADLEMLDCATNQSIGIARYRGHPFAGEFTLPLHLFSPIHDLFIKVDRRPRFFDEAGWIEIPSVPSLTKVTPSMISTDAYSLAVRSCIGMARRNA